MAEWGLEKKKLDATSRSIMRPKIKSGLRAPNLKSYYEYHIWGFQKAKNKQNIPIKRGCMNFKNMTFY